MMTNKRTPFPRKRTPHFNEKKQSQASRLAAQINRKQHQPFRFPDFYPIDTKGLIYEKRISGEIATEIVIVELTPNKKIHRAYIKTSPV